MSIYKRVKSIFQKKTTKKELYFSNELIIDELSQKLINELASYKNIATYLEKTPLSTKNIMSLEHEAFNILIRSIEIEKNNSKVDVGVIGSFSSGKSTFINSLFQKSICPMSVKPTTSSITKFYYGEKEKITLNNKEISQDEYHNLSQHLEKNTKSTETHYIEYAYPFKAFNSIVLYDTPGFNNNLNDNDTEVTLQTLEEVDVILFVVDIAKGDIDKSSMELLKRFKNKRIYCILNKSDAKAESAVQKIKEEIIAKKIFMEVIEYSALKVLEQEEDENFLEIVQKMEHQFISNKKEFTSTIKGSLQEKKGRRTTKTFYQLEIDNKAFILDDFSHKAKAQREKIEKLLNNISQNKQFSLIQSFKRDKYTYEEKTVKVLTKLRSDLSSLKKSERLLAFESDLDIFYDDAIDFQDKHFDSLYTEWKNYAFVQSCTILVVSSDEKDFMFNPYYKIYFDKERFKKEIEKIVFVKYFNNFMEKQINIFKEKWGCELHTLEFKTAMYEEALFYYSACYTKESYLFTYMHDIYFKDKNKAKEKLNEFYKFEHQKTISAMYDFIESNKEYIERFKQTLYSEDETINSNVEEAKKLINKILKDNKKNVR